MLQTWLAIIQICSPSENLTSAFPFIIWCLSQLLNIPQMFSQHLFKAHCPFTVYQVCLCSHHLSKDEKVSTDHLIHIHFASYLVFLLSRLGRQTLGFILSFSHSPSEFESHPPGCIPGIQNSSSLFRFHWVFDFLTHSATLTPLGHALELNLDFNCGNHLRAWVVWASKHSQGQSWARRQENIFPLLIH